MPQTRVTNRPTAVILGLAAAAALTGCVRDLPPFDVRDAQKWVTNRDNEVKFPHQPGLPTTVPLDFDPASSNTAPAAPGETLNVKEGPPIAMSLREIIHRTVANNLDVRVAAYDTAIDQTRVMEAVGNFDPTFFTDYSFERVDKFLPYQNASVPLPGFNINKANASSFRTFVATRDQEAISTFDIGFRQNLPAGGKIEIKQTVTNQWYNPPRGLLNPYNQDDLTLTITQPLLQNFGLDVNRARIDIARNNQRVSLMDFRKTVEDTVLKAEQTYWQLVQSNLDVETIKRLIGQSEKTTDILIRRQNLDTGSIQVRQGLAEISSRRAQLARAQARAYSLSSTIKQLMNDPRYPVAGSGVITPADSALEAPLHFNLDEMIETAMTNRLELGQQQVRIESSDIAERVAKNGLLPSLNLQGSYNVDGEAHHFEDALGNEGNFNHNGFSIGLGLEIPIGNRAARAVFARAVLQQEQARIQYGALVLQVSLDVVNALRDLDANWTQLTAARLSVLNYRELVQKQEEQFAAGGDQQYSFEQIFVRLQNQQQLAAAEQVEHQALNDYNFAIATLEKTKGTILRYNNVILEQDQMPVEGMLRGEPRRAPLFSVDNRGR